MENNNFYVWDEHNKVYASNPDMVNETEYFVWDPHSWWEYNSALMQGVEFFPRAEIYRGIRPPDSREFDAVNDKRKKVALLFYEHINKPWTQGSVADDGPIQDYPNLIHDTNLGWADLVITHTTEPMNQWWPIVYGEICKAVHKDQIKCLFAGKGRYTKPPVDRMFCDQLSFFSYVVHGNDFRDINEVNTPFRKYMFDALLGTTKTGRLYTFYRLMDSGWAEQVLINLQPRPFDDVTVNIHQIDPEGYSKYGIPRNYSSPGLFDLEEPEIQEFKRQTENGTDRDRYSVNLIPRPGKPNVPGANISMSVAVPWSMYQSSWYSIVCETSDTGSSNRFLTEKTAKCLFAKRIFVLVGCAGMLERLHHLGFQTFHGDIIDESYDNEPDDAKRYAMAWEQINRLYHTSPRDVYAHFRSVLDHNHQTMLALPNKQQQEILQFINQPLL